MDYKEIYEKALEKARKYMSKGYDVLMPEIFPELAESEDERIRKGLIEVVSDIAGGWPFEEHRITKKEALAYLEKQKDASKAIEAVDRIDKYIDERLANAHDMKDSNPDKKYYRGWDDALGKMAGILQDVYSGEKQKEQKPADRFEKAREKYQVEWSEEDERMLKSTIWHISNSLTNGKNTDCKCDLTEWLKEKLKSLRPSWKPSEEQIYSLGTVVKGYDECTVGSVGYHLKEMYEQLKKLM